MELFGRVFCVMFSLAWAQTEGKEELPGVIFVETRQVSTKKIKLSWKPKFQPKRGQLEYNIKYRVRTPDSEFIRFTSKETSCTLKDLIPDTTYFIAVRATNTTSHGEWTKILVWTLSNKFLSNKDVTCNMKVKEVGETSVLLFWKVKPPTEEMKSFKEFQVIVKKKEEVDRLSTNDTEIRLTDLEPGTKYTANLYVILNFGGRIRIERKDFETYKEQRSSPKNLRVKAVTYKSIAVKWKHIKTTAFDITVTGYLLQFFQGSVINTANQRDATAIGTQRDVTYSEVCSVDLDSAQKSYNIQELMPATEYFIRVAGIYNNITGHFTEWLIAKTDDVFSIDEGIYVYHTSPTSVLLLWEPFTTMSNISQISGQLWMEEKADQNIVGNKREFSIDLDLSHYHLEDLLPQTKYIVAFQGQGQCSYLRRQIFTTTEAKCFEGCKNRSTNETYRYESHLRLIPLQLANYLVTWQPYRSVEESRGYLYVIRVLGEPFMHLLSTHVVNESARYVMLHGLSKDKTYTLNIQVFEKNQGGQPVAAQFLLVMPIKDIRLDGTVEVSGEPDMTSFWQPTSIDVIMTNTNETFLNTDVNASYAIQHIKEVNITLISKLDVEESWNSSYFTFDIEDYIERPNVAKPDDVTALEMTTLDTTCFTRGDPYPITSFLNISSNQEYDMENSDTPIKVSISEPKYVGSSSLVDGRALMGIRRFIRLYNVTYWDTNRYACAAENIAGSDSADFKINIRLRPPEKVIGLYAKPLTPFEIEVGWRPQGDISLDDPAHVIGYHVAIADEYNIVLKEKNVSDSLLILQNMDPNKLYIVKVAAYHQHSLGQTGEVQVITPKIPTLGPPLNVTMVTLNSTTIQVSWLPPREVIERRIHLRSFLFNHREVGSDTVNGMELGRMFTNASIIDLVPDRKYEVVVLAMSEDGQISKTHWVQGNTSRESYMNETVPPPPPHNVYLKLHKGNIIISWLRPIPDENILVRGYTIDVYYNNTKLLSMEVEHKESSVIIYDVEMGVLYRISVRARNRAGTSIDQWAEMKVPVEYVTQEPVQDFRGVALSPTQLELSWEPPISGWYSKFVLSYTLARNLKPELPGGGTLPASSTSYIVRSLQPFTGYVFFITPYLKDMRGITANTTVVTLTDKPTLPPTNISLSVLNSTTILVKCSPPESGKNGPINQYRVAYRDSNFRDNILTEADDDEDLEFHLNGLKQDTVYEIRVRALNVNGSGPWSPWLQERTEKRVPVLPKVPRNLTVEVSGNTITMGWVPPEQHLSEITGYVVGFGRFIPEVYRTSIPRDSTGHVFGSLDPETVYIVSVRSFNDFGESAAVFDLVTTE